MNTRTLIQFAATFAVVLCTSAARAAESGHSSHTTGLGKPLSPGWEPAVHDRKINTFTLFEKAEFRTGDMPDAAVFDAQGWIGGDFQRFWWKAEGEQLTKGAKPGEIEVQALYSRLFSPFWDVQAGVRLDRSYSGPERETRVHLVIALEGLAPYWFEIEPALFISDKGKVSFSFTGSYDLLLTQRLVLQPRVDLRLDSARQDSAPSILGEGVNDLDVGLRLRYDIRRQFSPYIGLEWHRAVGSTAGITRNAGKDVSRTAVIFGLRAWF